MGLGFRVYIGVMEKTMGTTIVGYIGIIVLYWGPMINRNSVGGFRELGALYCNGKENIG